MGDINTQLAVLNQVESFVNMNDKNGGIVPSTLGVSDPVLSQLVEKLYTSELEYEKLKSTTAENNPTMISLKDRMEKIRPNIMENIQSQRRGLQASRNNISSTNGLYASALRSMPAKERELIDINRDQSIKNGIYTFLLQKREETALSYAASVTDSRIINNASSSETPVSPKKKIVYLASIIMALLAAMGFVYARESFSRKVMFRYEIEQLTALPIIGEISTESSDNPIVVSNVKKTFIAEQFRKLRVSLSYISVNTKHKRILVTSSITGEGKSFIASNLALTLSLSKKKVVLLDFDLNNPTLNQKLKIENQKGIAEYLEGEVELSDIIVPTDINDNLFMITTGALPDNPTELIMNGRVEELLNQLDEMFDYIIIDTAPVMPVTDAYILAPYCNATLYVVRHGYTPKVFVERLDENNKINHLNNAAIVFNGVTPRGFGSSHYGYGYGYGYLYDDTQNRKRISLHNN
jgi:capsular exopolysaccharide synthesis family protein